MSKAKKLGVVVFINEDFDERLAALQWASDYSPRSNEDEVVILLVEDKNGGSNKPGRKLEGDELSSAVPDELQKKFDEYIIKFVTKKVSGRPYEGTDIRKMLEGAIKKFKLDTLVLGMADLRMTSNGGSIDLLLDSECSVVLVKTDPKPRLMLKTTTVEIPDAPTEVPAVSPVNLATSTVGTSHSVDPEPVVPNDKETSSGSNAEDQKKKYKKKKKNNEKNRQPTN